MGTRTIRRFIISTVGLTAALLFAATTLPAVVTGQRPEGFRQGGRGGFIPRSVLLGAIDTNQDGTVAASELEAAPGALKALDRDGDGRLSGTELLPPGRGGEGGREGFGEGRRGGRGNGEAPGETPTTSPDELIEILMSFDDNGDGRLVAEEVPERFRGLFDRADSDQDGAVTSDEIRASAAAIPEPAGGGRGGRGGRGRGQVPDLILTALDADRDGSLSAEELAAAGTALLSLDSNADGQLTAPETTPAFGPRRGGFGR